MGSTLAETLKQLNILPAVDCKSLDKVLDLLVAAVGTEPDKLSAGSQHKLHFVKEDLPTDPEGWVQLYQTVAGTGLVGSLRCHCTHQRQVHLVLEKKQQFVLKQYWDLLEDCFDKSGKDISNINTRLCKKQGCYFSF